MTPSPMPETTQRHSTQMTGSNWKPHPAPGIPRPFICALREFDRLLTFKIENLLLREMRMPERPCTPRGCRWQLGDHIILPSLEVLPEGCRTDLSVCRDPPPPTRDIFPCHLKHHFASSQCQSLVLFLSA